MTDKKNNDPGDEFDRIAIPAFLARPFEALGGLQRPTGPTGRTGPAGRPAPAGRPDETSADAPRFPGAPGGIDAPSDDDEPPARRSWWAGLPGKLLLYGVGTVVMVFLQTQR